MKPQKDHQSSGSYLERLSFDPSLLGSIIAKYIANIRVVMLLILTITLVGIVSYFNLPKRLNPEVEIPIVLIQTVLPGASPEDIESLVTVPIEEKVNSIEGLDVINSVSSENVSIITLQFLSDVNRDAAVEDVQSSVDTINNLPEDALDPIVEGLDFENVPVWTFIVTSENDVPSLMNFSKKVQERLEAESKIDKVTLSGFEEQEVSVIVDEVKAQQYGINPLTISQLVNAQVGSYPAGTVTSDETIFTVTIDPSISSIEDIRQIPLLANGEVVTLGAIARVQLSSEPYQQASFIATAENEPERAITFSVYKTQASNITDAAHQAEMTVEEVLKESGETFHVTTLINTSEDINEQFTELLGEFRTTIFLVFICIFLFLGLRQALISSLTVPLTFLSVFALMTIFGQSINFLSLFAFLLALGLLVDDTIVVIQAMTMYYRTGKFTTLETGLMVWKDTIVPIWSTTITTIWSFVPLLLATGIIGEFIKPIPIIVTLTMISSTAIAVLITLPIMIVILKPTIPRRVLLLIKGLVFVGVAAIVFALFKDNPLLPLIPVIIIGLSWVIPAVIAALQEKLSQKNWYKNTNEKSKKYVDHGVIPFEKFSGAYYNTIYKILGSRNSIKKIIIATIMYAVFSFALLPLGFVQNEFFPKTDEDTLYMNIEYPAGTTVEKSQAQAVDILNEVRKVPEAEFAVLEVGKSVSSDGSSSNANNTAQISFNLKPAEERNKQTFEISNELRNQFKNYPLGKITLVEVSGGPPAGADLQVTIVGKDLTVLHEQTDKIITFLEGREGVTNVQKSISQGTSKLVFVPDQNKLADAGISVSTLGFTLRTYASGFVLDTIRLDENNGEEIDVVFRNSLANTDSVSLSGLTISNQQGKSYPLSSLGTFVVKPNPTQITREDGNRTLSVSASVKQGVVVTEENKALEEYYKSLELPEGYSWKTGGVNEENQKSINSILQAMGLSSILILVTMVIQFQSFRQAFIVLIVIPLAVSSVFLVFALTGTPLSFPALIGVLSLFGIVVTNSMFIVDKINLNQKEGMPLREAIADAGASRLEPIILTKLCTILGLLPITLSDPLWRGLGGAIISGILISSSIMLLFIPAVYYMIFADSKTVKSTKVIS